jgi:hypothetical protein
MSLFLNLDQTDPYDTFAVIMRRSRLAMERTYEAAFDAHRRGADLLDSHLLHKWNVGDSSGFPIFAVPEGWQPEALSNAELEGMWLDAISEDFQADHLATPIVLTADDCLKRLANGIHGKPSEIEAGYGPEYGPGKVPLTSLLTAATNTLRHVSEWDEKRKPAFPYKPLSEYEVNSVEWQAMRSITVIQRAFGHGIFEAVRGPVSMRVLVAVDGLLGTSPPSYDRFEAAVLATARAVASAKGKTPLTKLETAIRRQAKMLRNVGR